MTIIIFKNSNRSSFGIKLPIMPSNSLIQKYNVPGPRYTSYPTVPYWESGDFSYEAWMQSFKNHSAKAMLPKESASTFTCRFAKAFAHFVAVPNALPKTIT